MGNKELFLTSSDPVIHSWGGGGKKRKNVLYLVLFLEIICFVAMLHSSLDSFDLVNLCLFVLYLLDVVLP